MNASRIESRAARTWSLRGCAKGASSLALAAAIAGPLAIGAGQAHAADADKSAKDTTVSEVVVTAEFSKQNLQKTPISITAVTAEQLTQRNITSVIDVAQAAPNVTMTEGSAGFGKTNQAFIRGIGQVDFSFAFEPKVGFYIDDVYYATTFGSVFDLLDVDRVEIERGPQGTLNGRNSVGGAIRIFTKKPSGDGSGYIEGTYGSFNRESVKGAIDVPLVADKLMLRLSAAEHREDGWVKRLSFACVHPEVAGTLPDAHLTNGSNPGGTRNGCQIGTLGGENVFDTRAQLRWVINDRLEDNVSADYTNDRSEAPPDTLLPGVGISFQDATLGLDGVSPGRPPNTPNGLALWLHSVGAPAYGLADPIAAAPPFPPTLQSPLSPQAAALLAALNPNDPYVSYAIYGNPGAENPAHRIIDPPISTVKSWGIANNLDWDLSPSIHATSITSYRSYTGAFGSSQNADALPQQEVYNEVAHHQLSQEIRLGGKAFGDHLDWTVGGFYLSTFNENSGRVQTAGFSIFVPTGPTPAGFEVPFLLDMFVDDKSTLQNESAFVHGVFHFNEQLSLEGGVRFTHETKGYSYFRQNIGAPPSLQGSSPDTSISKWNPRVALNYQVTPSVLAYASFSTGFTAGGNDPRPFFPGDVNLTVAPEDAKAYEVGFKSQWFDNRLRLNADAFFTDYKNIQAFLLSNTTGCVPGTNPPGHGPCTIFYYGNGGNAHIKGFEAEAEARILPQWSLTAAVGYTDFRYVTLAPGVNPTNDQNGQTLDSPQVQTPKFKASLGTQYDIDLGGMGTLTPHVDMVYQSTVHYSPSVVDPIPTQKGYSLWNARLTWRPSDPNWSVSGWITNFTNKLYYTQISNQLNNFGSAYGQVGAPRQFGVTVRRNF